MLFLSSKKKQSFYIDNSKLKIKMPITRLDHVLLCSAEYVFDLDTNDFYIDFYDDTNYRLDNISKSIIDIFRVFSFKMSNILYISCEKCQRYSYQTPAFNFKSGKANANLSIEKILLSKKIRDEYIIYQIYNDIELNETQLWYGKSDMDTDILLSKNVNKYLKLPLMPFISEEKTLNKLETLITFS
jgi:hypothetical protein